MKVLIVEDQENIRKLIRKTVEKQGYELQEAEDGKGALAAVRQFNPDLVILDLMLPDMWGYEVCEELKKDPRTSHVKVLMLTARKSGPSQKMGELKGAEAYMIKPFKPNELNNKIRELLEIKE